MVIIVSRSWEIYAYVNKCVSNDNGFCTKFCQMMVAEWALVEFVYFIWNAEAKGSWVVGIVVVRHKRQALLMVTEADLFGWCWVPGDTQIFRTTERWLVRFTKVSKQTRHNSYF